VSAGVGVRSVVRVVVILNEVRRRSNASFGECSWGGEHQRSDIAEAPACGRIELSEIYGAPETPAAGAAGGAPRATAGLAAAAPELPGWRHVYSGKVRDLYIPESAADVASAESLLMVASDQIGRASCGERC